MRYKIFIKTNWIKSVPRDTFKSIKYLLYIKCIKLVVRKEHCKPNFTSLKKMEKRSGT